MGQGMGLRFEVGAPPGWTLGGCSRCCALSGALALDAVLGLISG